MDIFGAIADERRGLARLVSGLTEEQLETQSLCSAWSVREVVAHLVVPLEVGVPRFMLTLIGARGRLDRANVKLARQQAQRPVKELVDVLERKAGKRFTPPGKGPEAPLTDVLVHGLDIRRPLGIQREVPPERLLAVLTYLTTEEGTDLVPDGAVDGLRLEATDLPWSHGSGPVVRGPAESLLLIMTGRSADL